MSQRLKTVNGYKIEPFANLQGAQLQRARLGGMNLYCVNFRGADLSETDLRGAYLAEAQLSGAILTACDLSGREPVRRHAAAGAAERRRPAAVEPAQRRPRPGPRPTAGTSGARSSARPSCRTSGSTAATAEPAGARPRIAQWVACARMSDWSFARVWDAIAEVAPDREAIVAETPGAPTASFATRAARARDVAVAPGRAARRQGRDRTSPTGPSTSRPSTPPSRSGAVPVNVNYRYGAEEIRYLLDDSDAKVVVTEDRVRQGHDARRASTSLAGPGRGSRRSCVEIGDELRRRDPGGRHGRRHRVAGPAPER